MGELFVFRGITPQEEIFCQNYCVTVNLTRSAYHAGFLGYKEEKTYDKLTVTEVKRLSELGKKAVNKPSVKKRISEISKYEAEKNSAAELKEILAFLTTCIRKSKENLDNLGMLSKALYACELMLKRYPDVANDVPELHFKRG